MKNPKKCLIVIGGNRSNNFETFAPIVLSLTNNSYELISFFQNKKILDDITNNKVLNNLYKKKIIVSKKNFNLYSIIKLFFYLRSFDSGIILTNRFYTSIKFKFLILILNFFKFTTIYTKSFSRPPAKNLFSIVGPDKPKSLFFSRGLSNFCLMPTKDHFLEYGVIGYTLNQMIISGYPKLSPQWKGYCMKNVDKINIDKIDFLIVLGIYHDNICNIVEDLIDTMVEKNQNNIIFIKPHPTTNLEVFDSILIKYKKKNLKINFTNQNILTLSFKSNFVITHATSSSIDASIGCKKVICYWGESEEKVKNYVNNPFYDERGFEILESNLLSRDFVSNEIFTKEQFKNFIENEELDKSKHDIYNENFDENYIFNQIEKKIN